jgi:hypothetical protein
MKYLGLIIIQILLMPIANGQDLVPATSEDIKEFDRQVVQMQKKNKDSDHDNFGAQVQQEAKQLKDNTDQKNAFGKWVSSQRKKSAEGRPSVGASLGVENRNSHANEPHPNKGNGKKIK